MKKKYISLKSLCGKRFTLNGVDREQIVLENYYYDYDDSVSECIRFKLNDVIYCAIEDNNDGYRSAMAELFISDEEIKNKFPGHEVITKMKKRNEDYYGDYGKNDTLMFIDVLTNKIVLEVGTDNYDDYYPMFVNGWRPNNLAINDNPALYDKVLRLKKLSRILN